MRRAVTALAATVALALGALSCGDDVGDGPPPSATVRSEPSPTAERLASDIAARLNAVRTEHDLPRLEADPSLTRAAEGYAEFLSGLSGQFGHDLDGTPLDRAKRHGYAGSSVAEILAGKTGAGPFAADEFVRQWLDSAPHRNAILDPAYRFVGAGCWQTPLPDRPGEQYVMCVCKFGTP